MAYRVYHKKKYVSQSLAKDLGIDQADEIDKNPEVEIEFHELGRESMISTDKKVPLGLSIVSGEIEEDSNLNRKTLNIAKQGIAKKPIPANNNEIASPQEVIAEIPNDDEDSGTYDEEEEDENEEDSKEQQAMAKQAKPIDLVVGSRKESPARKAEQVPKAA